MAGFDVVVAPATTNGAYSAGDIIGGLLSFRTGFNQPLIVNEVQVALKAAVTPSLTLILLEADPSSTTKTDNAAYSLAAADVFKVRASVAVSTLYDHGTPNTYRSGNVNIVMSPAADSDIIYGLLIDASGVTLTSASDIQVRLAGITA